MKLREVAINIKEELRPFFNLRISNWQDVLSLILGIVIFLIVLYQAYTLEMTYDEAYTYLNTGRIDNVWQIYQFRIANTHFLNSLLMSLTTLFFPFNDLAIRLPAILFGGFYIVTAISFARNFKNRFLLLGLLFFFYFFTMYLSLARGYGMSSACVLAMIFVYSNKESFKNWFVTFSVFALLAMYGNYVAIPIILVFGAYIYIIDFKFSLPPITLKSLYWLIGFFLLGVYGFYSVTKVGKPLYGAFDETFWQAIPMDWLARFVGGYNTSSYEIVAEISYLEWLAMPVFLVIAVGIFITYIKGGKKNAVGVVTMVTLILIFIISEIGSKPLPTGRVLLPFWPLIVVSIIEVLEFWTNKFKVKKGILSFVNVVLMIAMAVNYGRHLKHEIPTNSGRLDHFHALKLLKDYSLNFSPQDLYYDFNVNMDDAGGIRPEDFYYIEKERRAKGILAALSEQDPDKSFQEEGFTIAVYEKYQLVSITFTSTPENQKFERYVLRGQDTLYSGDFMINKSVYENTYELPLIIPFPSPKLGNQLLLKSKETSRSWSIELDH